MNTKYILYSFYLIVFIFIQTLKAGAVTCNCSFVIDEVIPCSSLCTSDGSITIVYNEQFCNSSIRWGIILDGDTLEDLLNGPSGCTSCQHTFSNLSPGSYSIYRITTGNPACLAEETVGVGGLPVLCQSPYSISIQPPSVYGCYDGNITLANNSDCSWMSYFYDSDTTNPWAGPFPNTYSGGIISLQSLISNGIPPGTYYLHSISNLPTNNGTVNCDIWDTIVVNASCFIHASVTAGTCANAHCNCSFKVSAVTNGCAGYYSDITPLGGPTSNPEYAISGDTITFNNLYPQTYVLHTYPFSFGVLPILCEQYDTVVVHDGPCSSPYSILVQQPTSYSCYNGNINLTNTADCYWLSYLYKNDTTNFIGGPWDNVSYGTTFSLNTFFGGFNSGTYYIRSVVYNQTYFGQMTFCNVWDTIVLNAPCTIAATAFTADCANTNCGCSIKVVGQSGGCSHYEARLSLLGGTLIAQEIAFSGDTLTFDNLYPGTYVIRSFPESNGLPILCEDFDTLVIQNGPCLSPYSIVVDEPDGYNCPNGNITLTNQSRCLWISYLYANDTNQVIVGPFMNELFDGVISLNYFTGGLGAGIYYIHSYTYIPFNSGQYTTCDVWDTIVVGESCRLSGFITSKVQPVLPACIGGSFNVVLTHYGCEGVYVNLLHLADSSIISSQFLSNGDHTVQFTGLDAGSYLVEAISLLHPSCIWRQEVSLICQEPLQTLNVKVLIEGFYLGSGLMQAAVDPSAYPNLCDTIIVELHDAVFPFGLTYSSMSTINTNGEGIFSIPGSASGNDFYIVVKHRNALETWSANPVLFIDNAFYDFTNGLNKAFGNNQIDLGDGRFALYSGDISDAGSATVGIQDGIVESQDYGDMENAVAVVLQGYTFEDITGDNIVESADYGLMENNVYFVRGVVRP